MAYTPIVVFPNSLKYFQWSTPTNPNPRLAAPISATDTTITVTSAPLDYDGSAITGSFIMGIRNTQGYVEHIWCPAGSVSGTTITGVTRGIRLAGLDYTTAGTSLASAFDADSPVFCSIDAFHYQAQLSALNGTVASGGTNWKIGDGTDQDITVYAYNADTNKPYWKYDKGTNAWVFSNDGVSSTPFGTGAGVTAGTGIDITAGVVSSKPTDNASIWQNNSYTYKASIVGTDSYAINPSPAISAYAGGQVFYFYADVDNTGACTLNVNAKGAVPIYKWAEGSLVDLETGDIKNGQINQVVYNPGGSFNLLSPVSSVLTKAHKDTLTGGASSNANGLHGHTRACTAGTKNVADGSADTLVFAHGLAVTPTWIKVDVTYDSSNHSTVAGEGVGISMGVKCGTSYATTYAGCGAGSGGVPPLECGTITNGIMKARIDYGGAAKTITATATADGTNVTLAFASDVGAAYDIFYKIECGV